MKNYNIDNSIDLGDVILWQYQNAERLKKLVALYETFYATNVKKFHDDWRDIVFNIEKPSGYSTDQRLQVLDKFSLSVWGAVLGYTRPTYKVGNTENPISDDLYRKLLKARFRVMRSNGSLTAILKYLKDAFDSNVMVDDTAEMALHFSIKYPNTLSEEAIALIQQNPDSVFVYPAGVKTNEKVAEVVFGFDGQQRVATTDPIIGGFDDSIFYVS